MYDVRFSYIITIPYIYTEHQYMYGTKFPLHICSTLVVLSVM